MVTNEEKVMVLESCLEYKEECIKLLEKNNNARRNLLEVLESSNKPNWTKQKIREELLEIARGLK